MKLAAFALRNTKEILRDKLTLVFGLGFPVILLLLLSLIQANIPVEIFTLKQLTPGVAVFGLSFIALFAAQLISRDRGSSFMFRLFTSPLSSWECIGGYCLPLLPMALAQSAICYLVAFALGLKPTVTVIPAVLLCLPAAVVFIALGLLCGALLSEKQVGGICGALLTNLSAWLSGTWFDTALVGGVFHAIACALPFQPAVEAGRAALAGNYGAIWGSLWIVLAYGAGILILAIVLFNRRMRAD